MTDEEWNKANQIEVDIETAYQAGLAEGERKERERCAEIAEDASYNTSAASGHKSDCMEHYNRACSEIAAAIRGIDV